MIVDKNRLIQALGDWNFWEKDQEVGVGREGYVNNLERWLSSNQIVLVTGVRRSGKSFILRQLAKKLTREGKARKDVVYVNFEDVRLGIRNARDLEEMYKTVTEYLGRVGQKWLILDEVQQVEEWERWVRMMHELRKAKIVVSGSNSQLLGWESGQKLTGRHIDVTVYPLSLREFVKFKQGEETGVYLRSFLEEGGFPLAVLEPEIGTDLLLTYFSDILERDVMGRYKVRKKTELEELAKFVVGSYASRITFGSAGKFLGLTPDAVKVFLQYLREVYLVFLVERYSLKPKEVSKSPRKVYCVDTGLANVVGLRSSQNLGRLAENAVYLELRRRGEKVSYWKDEQHREVDFVTLNKEGEKRLVQVCWNAADSKTKGREVEAIVRAWRELGNLEALVLSADYEGIEKVGGGMVKFVRLADWLAG